MTLGGGTLSPNAATTLTLSGVLGGAGGLTLNGAGTLVLSNASNSYTGGNTITAGTLSVGADADLGAAANTVTLNGGTLVTTGTFASGRAVTLGGRDAQPERGDDADAVGRAGWRRRPDAERRGHARALQCEQHATRVGTRSQPAR